MHKLALFTALSKLFGYVTWAASNAIVLAGKVSKKTISTFNNLESYDVDIFHEQTQMDTKLNISHAELLKLITAIEVLPNTSLIVTKRKTKCTTTL